MSKQSRGQVLMREAKHYLRLAHETSEPVARCECCQNLYVMPFIQPVRLDPFREGHACRLCVFVRGLQVIFLT